MLRLRQVLGNLLSNAVKYTERGEVQIRAAADEPRDGSCRLHFSVADSGPGIPESQHATVFQAFTQLENATRIGGTGLGLSIANRLVKLMGGDGIDLRSEPGHGSTFSFVLPFEVSERVRRRRTADNSEFAGLRVLVVDDSSSSYMQLEETLNEWSADVTVVNRGRVMLERLRSAAQRGSPLRSRADRPQPARHDGGRDVARPAYGPGHGVDVCRAHDGADVRSGRCRQPLDRARRMHPEARAARTAPALPADRADAARCGGATASAGRGARGPQDRVAGSRCPGRR